MMQKHPPLTVTHSELCREWSEKNFPFLPEDETAWSYSKVWWKGACGHEWTATITNRALNQTGCPYCTGRAVLKGFNDFATVHPELAAEWSDRNGSLLPDQVVSHSEKRVWWKCKYGHEWQTAVSTRLQNSCPICAKAPLIPGVNDLAAQYPSIAAEWSERNVGLRPDKIACYDSRQVWWRCSVCGEEYAAQTRTRTRNPDRPCPYCSGKRKRRHQAPEPGKG